MNGYRLIVAVALSACLASSTLADAPLIFDTGSGCGVGDPQVYAYEVDSVSYPMMEFRVGTNDLDAGNYADVLVPPGWQFTVEQVPMNHACGLCANVGEVSEGPCYGITAGSAYFWTEDPASAVEYFTFGFHHPWVAEDVGFELVTRREGPPPQYYTFTENWAAAVGQGYGPLHGPWAETRYCWGNDMCEGDEYCLFDPCAIETGYCALRPESCPDIWDPVCGCDGVTYQSACHAALAGMSVGYEGPCVGGPCWSNDDCAPEDYCLFDPCAIETGFCTPRPEICPTLWDPVCGCDGITYPNACVAAVEGMSVDYEGPCVGEPCWSNDDCDPADYCLFVPCAIETGVCTSRPDICPPLWDPVCGCDGVTYPNFCVAAFEGMSVDYAGACEGEPCWENMDCGETGYCFFEECDAETGVCQLRPITCPYLWDPVCGCDGVTYANDCLAAYEGVSLAYYGECLVADLNLDGGVDLVDYGIFVGCLFGPSEGIPLSCAAADFDSDVDVDLADFQIFQINFGAARSPRIGSYGNGGCIELPGGDPWWPCGEDEIVLTVEGDSLHVLHRNATYNCCPDDIVISLLVEGTLLMFTEEEILTTPCDCDCCYDVEATVVDLAPGEYTVEFCWQDYETGGERCYVENIVIP